MSTCHRNLDAKAVRRAVDAANVERHLHCDLNRRRTGLFHGNGVHRRLSLRSRRCLVGPRSHGAGHAEADVVAVDYQLGNVGDLDDGGAARRKIADAHREHVLPTQWTTSDVLTDKLL